MYKFEWVPVQNPESQNLEHSKSRPTQNPTKKYQSSNNYFKQSKYRAKYYSFEIFRE